MNNRTIGAFIPAFSRVVFVLIIVAAFGMAIGRGVKSVPNRVLGVSDEKVTNREAVNLEIAKTIEVIRARPDYAGAWQKLSVLYEQIGENDLGEKARITAVNLNKGN